MAPENRHENSARLRHDRSAAPDFLFRDDSNDVPDAIGRAIPHARVQVVDEEGRPVGCGEVSELWINCPGATSRYLNAPEETRAVLMDGWFKTGDLASISPEGFVQIMGRKRERILRGVPEKFASVQMINAHLLCSADL
jgi:long-subunit acyl-CoA synthetase (AMP-forming)